MEESEIWDKAILWGKTKVPDLPSNLEKYFQAPDSDISITSLILPPQHAVEILSWINRRSTIYNTEIPYEFKLLLRGGRDGFSPETFHRLCDNIPGTIVVFKGQWHK
ncbi:hypothetical protein C2G38_2160908 [Gigaspora rosea]|uniref:TLDc domain-containing protein n=1 Tax=Gigaspora rosea TaxID=44941 RepID=A0A397VZR1_9GLOM|nr:hypothetical protein C2G38_2160908 [Gigaspora rosea]